MKSSVPKQFLLLHGKPVLMHTLLAFNNYSSDIDIVLVLNEAHIKLWKNLCIENKFNIHHQLVIGGQTRFYSVQNGLKKITDECIIGIHDGVRPIVSLSTIHTCFLEAEKFGNAIPVLPVKESVRKLERNNNLPLQRDDLCLVQTPQCFHSSVIKKAYEQEYDKRFTDDATVVEATGSKIHLVTGNIENIKITTPFDLKIAEAWLADGASFQ